MPSEDQLIKNVQDSLRTRYIKYELLGSGACKKVYKAFDEQRGMEVAWNQVNVGEFVWSNEKERGRVFAEIRVLKQLKHKNIISMHDWWYDPKEATLNFITELFTDGTLRQYRRKHRHLEMTAIKRWAWQMLQGLVYLHGHNPPIIHRDLKADNIFVNGTSGTIKIGDLGFATLHQCTVAMSVIGTPEFMAPELYEEQYSEKVDVYSYGMCLLELATMQYPYAECKNAAQIYKKVSKGVPPEGLAAVPDPEMAAFIRMCICHDPALRPEARRLLKHPFFDCVRNAQLPASVPRPIAAPPATDLPVPAFNGPSSLHRSASPLPTASVSAAEWSTSISSATQASHDATRSSPSVPATATTDASSTRHGPAFAESNGEHQQHWHQHQYQQKQQQQQGETHRHANGPATADAVTHAPPEAPGLVIACVLPAVMAGCADVMTGRADMAVAGRNDGPTPAQVALTSFALGPRQPSRSGHSRSHERRFSELSEADLLFEHEADRTAALAQYYDHQQDGLGGGGGADEGGSGDSCAALAWHGSFERCSSPDMTSAPSMDRQPSAASPIWAGSLSRQYARASSTRGGGGLLSGSWKRQSGGGAGDGEEQGGEEAEDGEGSGVQMSSPGSMAEDEFASFSRHLRNNHVSLACRGRTERLLSFSMSFTNDSGHRKRIGFQYDEETDTAYDVALEMVEVLALDVESAHVVADRIQQEIERFNTTEAGGGVSDSSPRESAAMVSVVGFLPLE